MNAGRLVMWLVLAALTGCAATDTYRRPGTWHPDGANAANIAAMAANPEDLVHGRGSPGSNGELAARAIDRLSESRSGTQGSGKGSGGKGTGGAASFATPLTGGTGSP